MSPAEDAVVRGTALVSSLLFAVGFPFRSRPNPGIFALAWFSGWATCVVHVVLAFHLAHHWSHDAAIEATAKQTEDLVGFAFGGGVWINYLFLGVWGGDAAWRMVSPAAYWSRPAAQHWAIVGFLAFIVFNATIVFGGWGGRIVGIGFMAIAAVRLRQRRSESGG